MKRRKLQWRDYFEAHLVWQVIDADDNCVGSWRFEEGAREQAEREGAAYYVLVLNVLAPRVPAQMTYVAFDLETRKETGRWERPIRVTDNEKDWKADDYDALMARVGVRVEVNRAA